MVFDPAIELDQALIQAVRAVFAAFQNDAEKKERRESRVSRQHRFRKAELEFRGYYLSTNLGGRAEELATKARIIFDQVETLNPSNPDAEYQLEMTIGEYRDLIEFGIMDFQKHFELTQKGPSENTLTAIVAQDYKSGEATHGMLTI